MNTTEKLQRIRAKCVELIEKYPPCESVSGWRSTIAAIDGLRLLKETSQPLAEEYCDDRIDAILAAWPDELL